MAPRAVRPEGLYVVPDFVSAEEERALLRELLRPGAPRLDKGHLRFSNTEQQEYGPRISDAMERIRDGGRTLLPPCCRRLAARVAAEAARQGLAGGEGLEAADSAFLRVNHYNAAGGGYMHKHMDSKHCFGPVIACVSLLSDAAMAFYDTRGNSYGMAKVYHTSEVPIPRRSLYFMTGPARYEWQHGIRKDLCPMERLSLTFRTVRADAPVTSASAAAKQALQRKQHNLGRAAGIGHGTASKAPKAPVAALKRPAAARSATAVAKRPAAARGSGSGGGSVSKAARRT